MKIGIMIDELLMGGVQKTAIEEASHLRRLGYHVTLIVLRKDEKKRFPFQNMISLPTIYLSDYLSSFLKFSFRFPGFSFFSLFHLVFPFFVPLFIKRENFSIIISHGSYTCFTALMLKKIGGIPYIAFIHDPITYILQKVYSETLLKHLFPILISLGCKIDKLVTNSSDVVILPSKYHLNLMRKLTDNLIKIVYPGVEVSEKIPRKRGNHFIAVARWERGKNPFFLLDILRKLRDKNISAKLLMIGSWKPPTLHKKFLEKAKEGNLQNQVKLYGPVGRQQLSESYAGAMALIHPITEAFGMIGLEAAAYGCPFMIPKGSGVTELFEHGVHGFFPKEGNADEFADYICKLFSDEKFTWKMGYKTWRVAKNYSWKRHAEKLGEIIEAYS